MNVVGRSTIVGYSIDTFVLCNVDVFKLNETDYVGLTGDLDD